MNFEEILGKDGGASRMDMLPYGRLSKKQIERKFFFVLTVNPELALNDSFRKGLKSDYDITRKMRVKQQLHYELRENADGSLELEFEPGSYQTFAQLLDANPAIVAKSGFLDNVASQLFDALIQLHAQSIFHLCLSPRNVLIRKGDEMPMLLVHASSFSQSTALSVFDSDKSFIAPEVLAGEPSTERSDVYSLGRFLSSLFEQGSASYEYKKVIAKATRENPKDRYATIADMRDALQKHRSLKNSLLGLIAAVVIALGLLGVYVEMTPDGEDIEFLDAAPKDPVEDVFNQSFSPVDTVELEVLGDSGEVDTITVEQRKALDLYMKKSEEIFRKQFSVEADRILSKVYSAQNMNASEKKFKANNQAMRDELLKIQNQLAEQSGIADEVAGRISTEVIDQLTIEKQKLLEKQSLTGIHGQPDDE
jgi:hypothetical protein